MDDVLFCTLTNHGYINYTLNCLKSLEKIGMKDKLHVFCIDTSSFDKIKENHNNTFYFKQDIIEEGDKRIFNFSNKKFQQTMILKLMVIYECLKKSKYVLFTDGDIVYYKSGFIEYLVENIKDDNILIQNDKSEGVFSKYDGKPVCCAGFMFIKNTPVTLDVFNYNTNNVIFKKYIQSSLRKSFFDDQIYLRNLRIYLPYIKSQISRRDFLKLDIFKYKPA